MLCIVFYFPINTTRFLSVFLFAFDLVSGRNIHPIHLDARRNLFSPTRSDRLSDVVGVLEVLRAVGKQILRHDLRLDRAKLRKIC